MMYYIITNLYEYKLYTFNLVNIYIIYIYIYIYIFIYIYIYIYIYICISILYYCKTLIVRYIK